MKKIVNIIIFALLLLIFGSYMFTFQVRQDQVVFVETFGKRGDAIQEPGLQPRWPWPIQEVYTFDRRIHLLTTQYGQISTGDSSLVVQPYLGWRIQDDPKTFIEKAKGNTAAARRASVEKKLRQALDGAVTSVFGDKENLIVTTNTLHDGEKEQNGEQENGHTFEDLESAVLSNLEPKAEQMGVELRFVGIRRVGITADSVQVTLNSMVTQWNDEAATDMKNAEDEALRISISAKNAKDSAVREALAEADIIAAKASADEAKIFSELQEKDADLAAFLIELNAMEAVLKKETTLVLDEDFPFLEPLRGRFLLEETELPDNSESEATPQR
jgi:modulator of FtsH protease HflC